MTSSLTDLFLGITVAVIIGVGIAIPIILEVITASNITGLTATILQYLPVFIGVVLLVALARAI